jgi:hypothetical protein
VGHQCVVRFELRSAWSSDRITVTLTDNKINIPFTAFLAPRAELKRETKSWLTAKQKEDWGKEKTHLPGVTGINTMALAAPGRAKADLNLNCYAAEGNHSLKTAGMTDYVCTRRAAPADIPSRRA